MAPNVAGIIVISVDFCYVTCVCISGDGMHQFALQLYCMQTCWTYIVIVNLKKYKRWPRVTKPIMVGKTPCKLLCAFEVKVSNKLLARYKLLGPS